MAKIELLHGSNHIIEKPDINIGNEKNDYGKGFYCTRQLEMAKEWACKNNTDGFANRYELELDGLKVLDLVDGSHTVLNWIALLLKHRTISVAAEIAIDAKDYIIKNFSVDTSDYDVIIGYRADDSYFRYAENFVSNALPLRSLSKALSLGKLGEQTVLVSQKAFDQLVFIDAEPVDKNMYYPKYAARDIKAREAYKKEVRASKSYRDDIFVMDILRGEMQNDDPRIQRIIRK